MGTVDKKFVMEAAYYLWLARGCPLGTELENWLEAERVVGRMADPRCGLRELRLKCGLREYALDAQPS